MPSLTADTDMHAPLPSDDSSRFLAEMSQLMGIPADCSELLRGPSPFMGTGGMMCRLQLSSQGDETRVQPKVMLPVPAAEIAGCEVTCLLAIQSALLQETGWQLAVSPEGLVQLSWNSWIASPDEAVSALQLGSAMALHVLQMLSMQMEEQDDPGMGLGFDAAPAPAGVKPLLH